MVSEPPATDSNRRPVIPINDRGLVLGLDTDGTWIIRDRTGTWTAADRLIALLPLLERPPHEVTQAIVDVGAHTNLLPELLRLALSAHGHYWAGLVLDWLEAGYPATGLREALHQLKDSPRHPQPIRHRALRLWKRTTPPT